MLTHRLLTYTTSSYLHSMVCIARVGESKQKKTNKLRRYMRGLGDEASEHFHTSFSAQMICR